MGVGSHGLVIILHFIRHNRLAAYLSRYCVQSTRQGLNYCIRSCFTLWCPHHPSLNFPASSYFNGVLTSFPLISSAPHSHVVMLLYLSRTTSPLEDTKLCNSSGETIFEFKTRCLGKSDSPSIPSFWWMTITEEKAKAIIAQIDWDGARPVYVEFGRGDERLITEMVVPTLKNLQWIMIIVAGSSYICSFSRCCCRLGCLVFQTPSNLQ